jgi:hypothetical protein
MDDFEKLNRKIALLWLGHLDPDQEEYLAYASMCLGRLTHSAAEISQLLGCLNEEHLNSLRIFKLNRRYLGFARLAARDAAAGNLEGIVRLGMTLEQAELLCRLSNDDLDRLAFGWGGPIVEFARQAFRRGVALHRHAGRHHATAFVAARLSARREDTT